MTSPTPARTRPGWDIALSIVFMVFALFGTIVGFFLQLFLLAFTDDCPPKTCNLDLGAGEAETVWGIVVLVVLVSIVLTIVFLVLRRRAWWVALIGVFVTIAGAVLASALYTAAVGYGT